jgi:hypothetical protein
LGPATIVGDRDCELLAQESGQNMNASLALWIGVDDGIAHGFGDSQPDASQLLLAGACRCGEIPYGCPDRSNRSGLGGV